MRSLLTRRVWNLRFGRFSNFNQQARLSTTSQESKLLVTSDAQLQSNAELQALNIPWENKKMNMLQAINEAMSIAMEKDGSALIFGQDVAFGGVFRCTLGLAERFGPGRVFNTPLTEQGIVGFGAGLASMGITAIAEIQFADYIYPAFDQLVNEVAKFRYRSGGTWNVGGLTVRAPCSAVGHGGHYHSQSPEAYFAHTPGLTVVVPRGPIQAKGLLLASIRAKDPVIFLEPKILYRSATEQVPTADYELPLGKAQVLKEGSDITVLGWGSQIYVLEQAIAEVEASKDVSCELIDLRTILPWDAETITASVQKTGRLLISHEAPQTSGFAAEIAATIQQNCLLRLKAPIARVCGWDTPFPLVFERFYLPNRERCSSAIKDILAF